MPGVNFAHPISRRERAAATRARIIEAAYRLFSARGYEATTMQAIADEAQVAVQTVYFGFRTKTSLLAAVENRAAVGGGAGPDWLEQSEQALRQERDGRGIIELWAAATSVVLKRITTFVAQMGAILPMDDESISRRDRERDRWFQLLIDRLAALDALKPELTAGRAFDVARALVRIEAYSELTQRWGWSEQEWVDLVTGVLARELLDSASTGAEAHRPAMRR